MTSDKKTTTAPSKRSAPTSKKSKYRIPLTDWDNFISEFDGIDCNLMCQSNFPTEETVNLFQNPLSGMVYCRWCNQKS